MSDTKYTLRKPFTHDGVMYKELTLRGEVTMEDILSSHFQAKGKSEKHPEIYLVFRMWGLDVGAGEKVSFLDFQELEAKLSNFMVQASGKLEDGSASSED